jgi:hypothetical protein
MLNNKWKKFHVETEKVVYKIISKKEQMYFINISVGRSWFQDHGLVRTRRTQ